MTAQIPDTYTYKRRKYDIIAMSRDINFNPRKFGLNPVAMSSACWRGYVCGYKITTKGIFLDKLNISITNNPVPEINGVKPQSSGCDDTFRGVYKGLNLPIKYTGSIILGRKFIDRYYIHMGFQRAHAYEEVIEIVFVRGRVVRTIDHSNIAAEIRKQIELDNYSVNSASIPQFVEESFSLDSRVKADWTLEQEMTVEEECEVNFINACKMMLLKERYSELPDDLLKAFSDFYANDVNIYESKLLELGYSAEDIKDLKELAVEEFEQE